MIRSVFEVPRSRLMEMVGRITEAVFASSGPAVTVVMRRVQTFTRRFQSLYQSPTLDLSRPDYSFWQRMYYGQAVGLELSGLLVKPLVSKVAAWALGRPPTWKCENESSQEALDEWWTDNHPLILRSYRSSLKQGDAFLVINADLTISLLDPGTVDPIVDDNDFGLITGWRITQVLVHPESNLRQMVVDEYYADRRVNTRFVDGDQPSTTVYPNLIGRIPVIHIANQLNEGDLFGHPEAEGTVRLLQKYGEVFEAAIEGNILQGRPTPVINFDSATDLNKFWDVYGEMESRTLPDGTIETTPILDVNLNQLLTLTNGEFSYKTPGNFTEDVTSLLEIMFYLFLQHTEVPEFVMGNAIASSKASTETQMPVFEKFISGKQGETRSWLIEIATIYLAYESLFTPGVVAEEPTLQWRQITSDGRLTLATVEWAYSVGLLDKKTAIMLAPVEVEDIDEVLELAKTEFDARQTAAASLEQKSFEGRQNASAKSRKEPISDDAEVKDNESAVEMTKNGPGGPVTNAAMGAAVSNGHRPEGVAL